MSSHQSQSSSRILQKLRSSLSNIGAVQGDMTSLSHSNDDQQQKKVALLNQIIDSVEQERSSQQTPLGVATGSTESDGSIEYGTPTPEIDELNPPGVVGGIQKESLPLSQSIESSGSSYVEYEPSPELSPEVESYMHKVEETELDHPHEVIIADGSAPTPSQHFPSKPVIVIPISPEDEAIAEKKDPTWSIRWLREWSQKIMRMFVGKVIYQK